MWHKGVTQSSLARKFRRLRSHIREGIQMLEGRADQELAFYQHPRGNIDCADSQAAQEIDIAREHTKVTRTTRKRPDEPLKES